eukprot:3885757-Amphidinium_carterae.1
MFFSGVVHNTNIATHEVMKQCVTRHWRYALPRFLAASVQQSGLAVPVQPANEANAHPHCIKFLKRPFVAHNFIFKTINSRALSM